MKFVFATAAIALAMPLAAAFAQEPTAEAPGAEEQAYLEQVEALVGSLDPQSGDISLIDDVVSLDVPAGYYFLSAADARTVLEQLWGNPEDDAVLGMIAPEGLHLASPEGWAVVLTYDRDGYVSDEDAHEIDYDRLLRDMQSATEAENDWREENGYGRIDLVGWAEAPSYDADTHKMVWAKRLRFSSAEAETLNYNVRALGRRGVLNANFVATMEQLPEIRTAAPEVVDMISFEIGSRYADYQKGDKVAAYGLAGLIAGGVLAKKTGLIAILIAFGKKFAVLGIAGIAAAAGAMRRLFRKEG